MEGWLLKENAELQQQLESSEREKQTVRQQLISSQRQNQELRQRVSQVCVELMQCNEVLLTAGDWVSAGQGQGAKREGDSER